MKIIQSQHGFDYTMKFINILKSNCFRNKISRFCVSVYHYDYKNAFKLIHIVFVFALIRFVCGVNGMETTTMCPNCQYNATVTKQLAMMNIQSKLLDALGYTNPPESKGREKGRFLPLISKFMEMYNVSDNQTNSVQNSRDAEEVPKLQRQEEIVQGEQLSHSHGRHPHNSHINHNSTPIKFNLANLTSQDFKNASLMLYVNNSGNCRQSINVTVYQLTEKHEYILLKTNKVILDETSWIQVVITGELKNIKTLQHHKNDTTLAISLSYTSSKPPSHCPDLGPEKAFQHALLKFQYDDMIKKRSKRTAVRQDCTEDNKYSDCCRYPIEVDFDEMKWDFIISPRKYNAYYCAGDCPLLYNQKESYFHLLKQLKQLNTTVGPCCSPKKMNPISMLYFTNRGTILLAKVSNMIVESCGCA